MTLADGSSEHAPLFARRFANIVACQSRPSHSNTTPLKTKNGYSRSCSCLALHGDVNCQSPGYICMHSPLIIISHPGSPTSKASSLSAMPSHTANHSDWHRVHLLAVPPKSGPYHEAMVRKWRIPILALGYSIRSSLLVSWNTASLIMRRQAHCLH